MHVDEEPRSPIATHPRPKDARRTMRELMRRFSAPEDQDTAKFYQALAETHVPFLACHMKEVAPLQEALFGALFEVGRTSIPLGVGMLMHSYLMASIATYSGGTSNPELRKRADALLNSIEKSRHYVANTGSAGRYAREGSTLSPAATSVSGGYRLSGRAEYMSLATVAGLMVLTVPIDAHERGVFFIPLDGASNIELGPRAFGEVDLSDTRSVTMNEVFVPHELVLRMPEVAGDTGVLMFQRLWFQLLAPAVYLGASCATLEYVREFANAARVGETSVLAENDAFQATLGEALLEYAAAQALCARARNSALQAGALGSHAIGRALEHSAAAKVATTRLCSRLAETATEVLGTRALKRGSPLSSLRQAAIFGLIQPPSASQAVRFTATRFLSNPSALDDLS